MMYGLQGMVEGISFKYGGIEELENLLTYKEDVILRLLVIECMTIEQIADKTRTPENRLLGKIEDITDKINNNFDLEIR